MTTALVILALLVLGAGVLSLSQATLGVGLIGIACFLGIMARLAQAEAHTSRVISALWRVNEKLDAISGTDEESK